MLSIAILLYLFFIFNGSSIYHEDNLMDWKVILNYLFSNNKMSVNVAVMEKCEYKHGLFQSVIS